MDVSVDNDWVESYLTCILSSGLSKEYLQKPSKAPLSDPDRDIYAQYYVQQVMNTDEEGIVSAWQKAQAGGGGKPKDERLKYLAWRVWGMQQMRRRRRARDADEDDPYAAAESVAMNHVPDAERDAITPLGVSYENSRPGAFMEHLGKPLAVDDAGALKASLAPLRVKSEKSLRTLKGDEVATPGPQTLFAGRVDKLYIVLVSMHGLIRGEKMELGKDADTGGQVKYVVELAKNLALHPMVHRVDLLTRLIADPKVDDSYAQPEELLIKGDGEVGGAYIVRVKCGDPNVYLPKEELWPHVREFADNGLQYVKGMLREMAHVGEPCDLYAVHGHYADGGEVAALMSHTLDVEMVLTGHSLGRNKLDHLLKSGTATRKQIEDTYKISRRIEAEERALDAAVMVLSSTQTEIDLQWGLYDGYDPKVAEAVRVRRRTGRHMPTMVVIPPGLQFTSYQVELPSDPMQLYEDYRQAMIDKSLTMFSHVQSDKHAAQYEAAPSDLSDLENNPPASNKASGPGGLSQALGKDGLAARVGMPGKNKTASHASLASEGKDGKLPKTTSHASLAERDDMAIPPIWQQVHRFLQNPYKPVVLAMSRPDAKKNIVTLVKAFGSNPVLRNLANLVLIMGNRDNIDSLNKGSQQVIQQVLKLIDVHDLYGSVAYPKTHQQSDISDIYRLATKTRGVFTNIALQEPFGLTLIEAAVHGAPIVATKHGGPLDIVKTLKNGKLVEPTDVEEVGKAILELLTDSNMWDTCSSNGIQNILAYSWPSHCIQYLESIEREKMRMPHATHRMREHRHSLDDTDVVYAATEGKSHSQSPTRQSAAGRLYSQASKQADIHMTAPVNVAVPLVDVAPAPVDDLVTAAVRPSEAPPMSLLLSQRDRVAFAVLDNANDTAHLVDVMTVALKDRDPKVGLGVLTVFTFQELLELLDANKFDVNQLDFVVCNAGAYILCLNNQGEWIGDEAWDQKVTIHWDKQLVLRTLTRMSAVSRSQQSSASNETGNVMKILQRESATETDDGNGPMHCLLDLSADDGSVLSNIDNATLIGYVRKRVRAVGIRCNLTLQLVPRSGDTAISILHATPLRASRAMAVRHIFFAYGLNMAKSTFLCTPATLTPVEDGTMIGTLCSDTEALIQGAHQVIVVPPHRDVDKELEDKDAVAFERLKVSLVPYLTDRVHVVQDLQQVRGAI